MGAGSGTEAVLAMLNGRGSVEVNVKLSEITVLFSGDQFDIHILLFYFSFFPLLGNNLSRR